MSAPETVPEDDSAARGKPRAVLAILALLYTAQGIPFGIAAEYLPVIMREAHYSQTQIAAAAWLQLPWQAKILWAHAADHPKVRPRTRLVLLLLQCMLAVVIGAYAFRTFAQAPALWFGLTALAALFAATQDVFVDALAVRSLPREHRGTGNMAQVSGYRAGMLVGGALLLVLSDSLGALGSLAGCAAVVAGTSVLAFKLAGGDATARVSVRTPSEGSSLGRVMRHAFAPATWPVIVLAATFKLGVHMATAVLKPMVVDAHWSKREIGMAVVVGGTLAGFAGSGLGALLHRRVSEGRSLVIACILHASASIPLFFAQWAGVPRLLTTVAIGAEHFVSGLGTTVLFAALMSATRKDMAGAHYTFLTGANALAIGLGGMAGGALGDHASRGAVFVVGGVVSLLPLLLVARWERAAHASSVTPV